MGRHKWSRRYMVQDCHWMSIAQLRGNGCLKSFSGTKGSIRLQYAQKINDTIGFEESEHIIELEATRCFLKGYRWWFRCPQIINGVYCGKRVGLLYLPPNGQDFGCRHCYNLTYASCRRSRRIDCLRN